MENNDLKTKKGSKQIQELKQKVEEFENKYKRAIADYQNLDKRVAEERKELILRSNKELLLRLLPVLDTLMVAANHVKNEGLELSMKQFLDTLKEEGVEKIETKGKNFDPHLMECITTAEGEENKVIEEIRSGYMLSDKVLRAAQVMVGSEREDQVEGN
jgi:molecular chaperone GrpE